MELGNSLNLCNFDLPMFGVLAGGADCNQPVYVGQLHPGGVAQK